MAGSEADAPCAGARRISEAAATAKKNAGPKARAFNSNLWMRSARSARTCSRATTAAGTTTVATGTGAEHRLGLHRQQAFALQLLAGQLARAAHGFGLFTGLLLGGLFVVPAELHLAEDPLALHLLLQRLEGLIDIVVANENLHPASSSIGRIEFLEAAEGRLRPCPQPQGRGHTRSKARCPPVNEGIRTRFGGLR